MTAQQATLGKPALSKSTVHCPSCTHNVEADVLHQGRRALVKPGQNCPRCSAKLDAAYILSFDRAA